MKVDRSSQKPRRHLLRPRWPFWRPLAAILNFAGVAVAGGERVPLAPLGWYCICLVVILSLCSSCFVVIVAFFFILMVVLLLLLFCCYFAVIILVCVLLSLFSFCYCCIVVIVAKLS